jgi:hypothetical protein
LARSGVRGVPPLAHAPEPVHPRVPGGGRHGPSAGPTRRILSSCQAPRCTRSSLLVAAGLTPIDAITAATRHGASLLAADSLGMVVPGKVADLVVLNRNPAEDVTATRDIAWVMLRGRVLDPDSLRTEWNK